MLLRLVFLLMCLAHSCSALSALEEQVLRDISSRNPALLFQQGNECDAPWVTCALEGAFVSELDFSFFAEVASDSAIDLRTIDFSQLANISSLNFRLSRLREVPTGLERLPRLALLDLSHNELRTIRAPVFGIASLGTLLVDHNPLLSMQVPAEVGQAKALRYFRGGHCDFHGPLPASLANCTSLQRLELPNNRLSGRIPRPLSAALTQLILSNNVDITDSMPALPPNLALLALDNTTLNGQLPPHMPPNLQALYLQNTLMEGALPSFYSSPELRFCDLTDTFLDNVPPFDHACTAREIRPVCPLGSACTCRVESSVLVCTYPLQLLSAGDTNFLSGANVALGSVVLNGIDAKGDPSLTSDGSIMVSGNLNLDISGATSDSFVILEGAQGISGEFSSVTLSNGTECLEGATLVYMPTSVSVSLANARKCGTLPVGGLVGIAVACVVVAAVVVMIIWAVRRNQVRKFQGDFQERAKQFEMDELARQKERIVSAQRV